MARNVVFPVNKSEIDGGSLVVIITAIGTVIAAFLTGLWKWMSGRKKTDTDAQASLVSGFVALLAEFRKEREELVRRINECEADGYKRDRRISKLERVMVQQGIAIPGEDVS